MEAADGDLRTMCSNTTHFHPTGQIEAYDDDALIFERSFAETIERGGI
ncbi:MAG: hypothetical protein OSB69_04235 [Alphaproteobacteria bacterium]|nr:hypothetical protein [Alphaproteobacteria bacterium]